MPRVPLTWLADHTDITGTPAEIAAALVQVGLEEEAIHTADISGPLVVGRVLECTPEPQKNGKTIMWCTVDVGEHNPPGEPGRGIVCGAHNFGVGDWVVVALAGSVLPGGFAISARKTYGHISDGMICSERELGIGDDHAGIIVLTKMGFDPEHLVPGQDALGMLGLDETTIEVNVTPDRGYCFAIRGVAREYSHATGAAFRDPALIDTPEPNTSGFAVELSDEAPIHGVVGCDRYVARLVRGVDAGKPSPAWMQRRLAAAGMRPISLAVDVTNFVMLDLGQPLHAFDAAKLLSPIVVRRAAAGEHLMTLDDVDRALDPEDLLITDDGGKRILALAGVMGGAETEVTADTTDVLIEAAHFDPVSIARTARRHKLPSEASRRFERGVDTELQAVAAQRAAELMVEYGGGEIDHGVTDARIKVPTTKIQMALDLPERVIGYAYTRDEVIETLREIGCEVSAAGSAGASAGGESAEASSGGPDVITVIPPSWRPDLTDGVDLVEEVARLRGYDQIPSVVPNAGAGQGLTLDQRRRRSVARALAEHGLSEVLSYPFVGSSTYDAMGVPADDPRRNLIVLSNPIAAEAPAMRSELLSSVLTTARRNVGRSGPDVAIYEIGNVFAGPQGTSPLPPGGVRPSDEALAEITKAVGEQPTYVAGVMSGQSVAGGPWGRGRPWAVSDALACATLVARTVGLEVTTRNVEYAPFHPGRCAAIEVDEAVVGYAGELHPKVCEAFELPKRSVAFELNLEAVLAAASTSPVRAEPIASFPFAKEDLAFVVDDSVPANALLAAVIAGGGDLVESARIFDVFRGPQLGLRKKSVAISVRMRAGDRTLTAEDIASVRAGAIQAAEVLGAVLR